MKRTIREGARVVLQAPGSERASPIGQLSIAAVMSRDVFCVGPDLSVESLMLGLLERGLGGAPVVDDGGSLIGFVAMTDLVRSVSTDGDTAEADAGILDGELRRGFHVEPLARAIVRDVMVRQVITLPEHATISRAASIMAFEHIHQIPILSRSGGVMGIVTATEILRVMALREGYLVPPARPVRRGAEREV